MKPLDIEVPFEIISGEVATLGARATEMGGDSIIEPSYGITGFRERAKATKFGTLKAYALDSDGDIYPASAVLGAVSTAVFGFIHLAAWNSDFPSPTEKILWRICGSLAAGIPLIVISVFPSDIFEDRSGLLSSFLAVLYVISRMYLMVEPFVDLRNMPTGAYDTVQWASFIPHI